jgi:hypothetical protein
VRPSREKRSVNRAPALAARSGRPGRILRTEYIAGPPYPPRSPPPTVRKSSRPPKQLTRSALRCPGSSLGRGYSNCAASKCPRPHKGGKRSSDSLHFAPPGFSGSVKRNQSTLRPKEAVRAGRTRWAQPAGRPANGAASGRPQKRSRPPKQLTRRALRCAGSSLGRRY